MKQLLLLFLACISVAGAQATAPAPTPLTLPAVTVQPASADTLIAVPSQPLMFEVAKSIRVQPARLETRLQPGYTTGTLSFTLFSEVNTQVTVTSDDPRLVIRGDQTAPRRLAAYDLQSLNGVALAPHSGHIIVSNIRGEVIARVPYVIAPSKSVNQNVSLSYAPTSGFLNGSYSISGVSQSPLDPRWNVGIGLSVNTGTGQVNGGVSLNVGW